MANTSGQAFALMTASPVLGGRAPTLRTYLRRLPTGEKSPLARLGTTHFARWLVIDDLVYQGPPQVREHLKSSYLIFVSNFDGPLGSYIDAIARLMPVEADAIWGHCVGYPGAADPTAFAGFVQRNQIDTTFFVSAYPDASVAQVRESLRARERFTNFAVSVQGTDPAALRRAFTARFPVPA
ncbi:hypothetical protein [Frankia tisae]|uniref:hypothetical protein n=1 Tax=Frankia tisae TaxID=2950104 RepID=UPI0021C18E50|nr:hypothetical protein [Frankia tisae]